MHKQWILDILIKDGKYLGDPQDVEGSMWFVISCDGTPQAVATNQTGLSINPQWNFPQRIILQADDIARSYLYFTLCTYGKGGVGVVPIARSRLCLNSLPLGSPKQFSFPIMSVKNSIDEIIHLRVLATLSLLAPKLEINAKANLPLYSDNQMVNGFHFLHSSYGSH